jgi:hypothetical protein
VIGDESEPGAVATGFISELAKDDVDKVKNRPPNSISGYQLIHVPGKDSDPEGGKIFFTISGGITAHRNIWERIDDGEMSLVSLQESENHPVTASPCHPSFVRRGAF